MSDILIRNVPDDVIAAIDRQATRLGLSRAAYLRRTLDRERHRSEEPVTCSSLERLATLTADLDDPGVMADAWA